MSGEGGQSDGYRTHQRTVARFVGWVQLKRSRTNRKPRGRVMVTRRGYGTHQRPVALCAWAGLAKNKKINSTQLPYFANRTTHRFYFHPAHADVLYALTSIDVW